MWTVEIGKRIWLAMAAIAVSGLSVLSCAEIREESVHAAQDVGVSRMALTVSIHGTVADGETNPIEGVQVELIDELYYVVGDTTTDENGQYSVSVDDGVYVVRLTPPPESIFVPQLIPSWQEFAADTRLDFVFVPRAPVRFAGRLLDRDGAGLEGAEMYLYDGTVLVYELQTTSQGDFYMEAPPGDYALHIYGRVSGNSDGDSSRYELSSKSAVSLSGDTQSDIVLDNVLLTGTVLDEGGDPVAGAVVKGGGFSVEVGDFAGTVGFAAVSDEAGHFEAWVLPSSGVMTIAPPFGSPLSTTAVEVSLTEDTDIDVTLVPPVSLSGKVLDRNGLGMQGEDVCLSHGPLEVCDATNGGGGYQLEVSPGEYSLSISKGQRRLTKTSPVWLPADTVQDIVLQTRAVTGAVQDADADPVVGAWVWLSCSISFGDFEGASSDSVVTEADGRFEYLIFPCECEISAAPPDGAPYGSAASELLVSSDIELALTLPSAVSVSGRLLNRNGSGVSGKIVTLTGSEPSNGLLQTASATSASGGSYQLYVVPGDYFLRVEGVLPAILPTPGPVPAEFDVHSGSPVSVLTDVEQDIALENRLLTGRLVDLDGAPLAGVRLESHQVDSISFGDFTGDSRELPVTSSPEGEFELREFPGEVSLAIMQNPSTGLWPFSADVHMEDDALVYFFPQSLGERLSAEVEAGQEVSTDDEGDGATATDPIETTVTSPAAGTVSIQEVPASGAPPGGYTFLAQQVNIVAPPASADDPLVLRFVLESTRVPEGEDENSIEIFRNGVLIEACSGPTGVAAPDPCVSDRALIDDDIQITVLTSEASAWNFGVHAGEEPPPGDSDGDGVVDPDDLCPATEPASAVNDEGCAIADLCPCENDWKNHGAYVRCVTQTATVFSKANWITQRQRAQIVSAAARADCGRRSWSGQER